MTGEQQSSNINIEYLTVAFWGQVVDTVFLSLFLRASLVAQMVKHLPALRETWVWSPGGEDPLEKEMATHSSIFAWKIPWMEEPDRLQSVGSQRVGHDWATSLSFHFSLFLIRKNQSIKTLPVLGKELTYNVEATCLFAQLMCVLLALFTIYLSGASLLAQTVKTLPGMQETQVGKIPWRRDWLCAPVFLPGESHGQRIPVGHSPWGSQTDTTERLTLSQ